MSNPPQRSGAGDQDAASVGAERVMLVVQPESSKGTVEFDLRESWEALWSGRWFIAAVVSLCAVASVTYALLATQWFTAAALVVTASAEYGQSSSSQLSQLSGLATLAGINVSGDDESSEALAVLTSNGFTRDFIESLNLLPVLFADDWDEIEGKWKSDDPDEVPEIRDAIRYFHEEIRGAARDSGSGIVTVSISWTDPDVAAMWANLLVERLNERMRQRSLVNAEANVSYLKAQLGSANFVTLQQSISELLEGELEKVMIARGTEEFAFRFVDRAAPPKWRSRPRRVHIVGLSVMIGAFASLAAVLVYSAFWKRRHESAGQE